MKTQKHSLQAVRRLCRSTVLYGFALFICLSSLRAEDLTVDGDLFVPNGKIVFGFSESNSGFYYDKGLFIGGSWNGNPADFVGAHSLAIGWLAKAVGANCLSVGRRSYASGESSIAIGLDAGVSAGRSGIAIGEGAYALGGLGVAIGGSSGINGEQATAVLGEKSTAIESGARAHAFRSLAIGSLTQEPPSYSSDKWVWSDPLIVFGGGFSTPNYYGIFVEHPHNAVTVLKNGKFTIEEPHADMPLEERPDHLFEVKGSAYIRSVPARGGIPMLP